MQNGIVWRFADEVGLRSIQEAVRAVRVYHIPLIFCPVALRPGYPASHPRNRSFACVVAMGHMSEDDDATQSEVRGIATNGVVLSTVREAADKHYQLTVLKDAC